MTEPRPDPGCCEYCEHNLDKVCSCAPCMFIRSVGFVHADWCPNKSNPDTRRVGRLPLVGLKEIAQRAGLKKTSAVANWRIRYDDFPPTVADLGCGPVFWWPQVESWLRKTGRPITQMGPDTRPNREEPPV